MSLASLAALVIDRAHPCAVVDVDAFDRNCAAVALLAAGKRVRIATKSVRVPALIERVLARGAPFHGVMAYDAREAERLVERGIDDVLVAYPCMDPASLAALRRAHERASVSLVVDGPENVDALARAMEGAKPFAAVVEIDMSLRRLEGRVHLGVRRSPVRSVDDLLALIERIRGHRSLRFGGLMGYEAQVAGLGDDNARGRSLSSWKTRALDAGKRAVRKVSVIDGRARREELAHALASRGIELPLFNGGGSGSLDTTSRESCITEVTAGSALYAPHLFDRFSNVRFEPACFFALRVVRSSDDGYVTCAGGGYVASGAPGLEKVPLPVWPEGLSLVDTEACGEVQTPLRVRAGARGPRVGDVVLFRHAKAGELFERLDAAVLVEGGRVVDEAQSYRGLGWNFG